MEPELKSLSPTEKRALLGQILRERASRPRQVPLSKGQQRLWQLLELEPDSPVYNAGFAYDLSGPLDISALKRALRAVVQRHESLRTAFAVVDGEPVQVIAPEVEARLERVDLRSLNAADWPAETRRLAREAARTCFDLVRPPLWRFTLLEQSDNLHVFIIVAHHIISDRWSVGLLVQELAAMYAALVRGEPPPLSQPAGSYTEAIQRLEESASEQALAEQRAYWQAKFRGVVPELILPADLRPAASPRYRGTRRAFTLSNDLAAQLNGLAVQEGVTAYVALLAALAAQLHRDTGQTDLVLTSPVSGRHRAAIRGVIGYFNNLLPIRLKLTDRSCFRDLLRSADQVVKEAFEHQDVPFQQIAELPGLNRISLARCFFSLQNTTSLALNLPAITSSYYDVSNDTANFDLAVFLEENAGTYRGIVDAKTDLWSDAAVDQFVGRLQGLLKILVDQPDRPLADMPDRSATRRERLNLDGKVDRRALPATSWPGTEPEGSYAAPRTPVEETTAEIWAQVLGLEQVGVHDNFYECGGNSLLAVRLIPQMRDAFHVELPLSLLREAPTVADLSERIETVVRAGQDPPGSAPLLASREDLPPRPLAPWPRVGRRSDANDREANESARPRAWVGSGVRRRSASSLKDIYRFLALSNHPVARAVRKLHRGVWSLSVPAPRPLVKPILWTFLALRSSYYFGRRVFVCEPLFKAYCKQYGRRLRTGDFIHWVEGVGDIILGDDVVIDGKCSFTFATRFSDRPTLVIGDRTAIGHNCAFTVGKQITIGRHCLIASDVCMFDSNGHPLDPEARRSGQPPLSEDVQPIVIGDSVWVGQRSVIFPGVKIGECSIVSACSVVRSNVPPYTVVAGNPAVRVGDIPRAEQG